MTLDQVPNNSNANGHATNSPHYELGSGTVTPEPSLSPPLSVNGENDRLNGGGVTNTFPGSLPTTNTAGNPGLWDAMGYSPATPDSLGGGTPVKQEPETMLHCRMVASTSFQRMRENKRFPEKIEQWCPAHVGVWAKWIVDTFDQSETPLDPNDWKYMSGKTLAGLSQRDFNSRLFCDYGGYIWQHFLILKRTGMGTVPDMLQKKFEQQQQQMYKRPAATLSLTSASKPVFKPRPAVAGVAAPSGPTPVISSITGQAPALTAKKPKVVLGKYNPGALTLSIDEGSTSNRTGNNGNLQLWRFLLEILTDVQHM